jgi:hypothetical protein
MDAMKILESRMQSLNAQRDALTTDPTIAKYLKVVDEWLGKTESRTMNIHERRNVAQAIQNAIDQHVSIQGSRLYEATTADNIAFLGIQLPIIAALLPTLVLNELAVTQTIDRRIAAVFYLDVRAGSNKGMIDSGDTLLAAKTGYDSSKSGRLYAIDRVDAELVTTGEGPVTVTLDYTPGMVRPADLVLESVTAGGVRTVIATCNAAGTLVDVAGGPVVAGSVTIDGTGVLTISTLTGIDSDTEVRVSYDYQYDKPVAADGITKTGVPEVDVTIASDTVTARDFPLRAKFSLGASLDAQKAHGIDLENELVKYLGSIVKFTMDQYGLEQIDAAAVGTGAADAPAVWDASIADGQEWIWHMHQIKDRFESGSNNIFAKTKRGVATFIHCGNNVARVIRQLPDFKPAVGMGKTPPTGPLKIGELQGRTVVQNPFKAVNAYTMGWRGDQYLMAGFIFAPYIPLFTTPTLLTSDLFAQKGFYSSAGYKLINAGLYCASTITGLS